MGEERGSIAYFATFRPLKPLDIFSRAVPWTKDGSVIASEQDEVPTTDGLSSNYNGRAIPPAALKTILNSRKLDFEANEADVDSGRLSGLVFVSERENALETLHIALRLNGNNSPTVKVFNFAEVYGTFNGVRMEDSGCIAGDYLIYISTMEDPNDRRQPWTVLYKTNLKTGETSRLTPSWNADLSPAVSPSGKKVAVASFQRRGGWHGEIEDLQTDIYVMNLVKPFKRRLVVEDGGWPTWGSDTIIFFHRKVGDFWGVFRADINSGEIMRVTTDGINAMTPVAISTARVAVATIRHKLELADQRTKEEEYRHIEIFDLNSLQQPIQITRKTRPTADHFNPFVIDGGNRIGYHRCNGDLHKIDEDDTPDEFHKLKSPISDVGLIRMSGVFPTFSSDGSKLAFVDNEFRTVWLVEKERPPRIIYQDVDDNTVFSPVWNKSEDVLYICRGPSFSADKELKICAIFNASKVAAGNVITTLTKDKTNNAFPSTSPDGKRLVFRSMRDHGDEREKGYKKLYIMENAETGEYEGGTIRQLTFGPGTDTHCQWSPSGDWIVFSSTRDKPKGAQETDNKLDPGYFAVFLVHADKPSVVVRVIPSGVDIAGHVNHPFFSPDGKSIAVTADLAAVSVDPISLPLFLHSVRPYGDIFVVHIDLDDIRNNKDVKKFIRITHSRYENSTPSWTMIPTQNLNTTWNKHLRKSSFLLCP